MQIQLFGPQQGGRSSNLNAQRTINCFPVLDPSGKSVHALYGSPGSTLFTTCGDGPIRGAFVQNNVAYVVSGSGFYKLNYSQGETTATSLLLGTLSSTSGAVSFAGSTTQIMVADNLSIGYVYTIATGGFARIEDANFLGATVVGYLSGFAVAFKAGDQVFSISDLNDFTAWDALDFASAEASPDNLNGMIVDHGELWLFGLNTIEIWQNTGDSLFTLQRLGNTVIERGCMAIRSPAKVDSSIFWLGDDGVVYRANGYAAQRISNEGVEHSIHTMPTAEDAVGFTFDLEGHKFYALSFPSGDKTHIYDIATGLWHERRSGSYRWNASTVFSLRSNRIAGDLYNGKLYLLSMDVYAENGTRMSRSQVFPAIHQDEKMLYHRRVDFDFEVGYGLTTGQGSDPIVIVDWSDDGGHTWSNQMEVKIGKIGNYGYRATLNRLGASKSRNYRIHFDDPAKFVLVGARADIEAGYS